MLGELWERTADSNMFLLTVSVSSGHKRISELQGLSLEVIRLTVP